MAICVFFGTFNPIHIGHLKMAKFVLDNYGFEKILFVPAYIPPHKVLDSNLAKHRFNMVKAAISTNPKFDITDIEYKNEGKSYSLITVKKIIDEYKIEGKLNFIIGTDAFKNIKSWYRSEELKDLVHFIVFPREGSIINEKELEGYEYELVNSEKFDISSTQIRKNIETEEISEVKDYILKNGLYD